MVSRCGDDAGGCTPPASRMRLRRRTPPPHGAHARLRRRRPTSAPCCPTAACVLAAATLLVLSAPLSTAVTWSAAENHALAAAGRGYVTLPAATFTDVDSGGTWTFEAWLLVRSVESVVGLAALANGPLIDSYGLFLVPTSEGASSSLASLRYQVASPVSELDAPLAMPLNQWVHVALTHAAADESDGNIGQAIIYVDAAAVAAVDMPLPGVKTRSDAYVLRDADVGALFADAFVDDVRIWAGARTGDEITADAATSVLDPSGLGLAALLFDLGFEDDPAEVAAAAEPPATGAVTRTYSVTDSAGAGAGAAAGVYAPLVVGIDMRIATLLSPAPLSQRAVCGNGKRVGAEACDDGNLADGDGCSGTCTVESGWVCQGGETGVMADTCSRATLQLEDRFENSAAEAQTAWTPTVAPGAVWETGAVQKHGGQRGLRMRSASAGAKLPFAGCPEYVSNGNFRDGADPGDVGVDAGSHTASVVEVLSEPTGSGYALRLDNGGAGPGNAEEQRLDIKPRSDSGAPALSPYGGAVYRVSAWVWANSEFGAQVPLITATFFNSVGGEIGTVAGGFPTQRSQWQRVALDFTAQPPVGDFTVALGGVAVQDELGIAYVGGVSVTRQCEGIPGHMLAWYKSDVGLHCKSGEKITKWEDQSGNGHHFTALDEARAPYAATTESDGIQNTFPTVRFDGVDDGLQVDSVAFQRPYTIITVNRWWSTQYRRVFLHGIRSNWLLGLYYDRQGFHPGTWVPSGGWPHYIRNDYPGDEQAWYISSGVGDSKATSYWFNGELAGERIDTTNGRPDGLALGVGGYYDGRASGEVVEILVYRRALSAQELRNVHSYLSNKYAIALRVPNTAVAVTAGSASYTRDFVESSLLYRLLADNPADGLTWGERVAVGVTEASVLSFAARLQTVPQAWSLPLWVVLSDAALELSPSDPCVLRGCQDQRVYRLCFNSGTHMGMCDRSVWIEPGAWSLQAWRLGAMFDAKYGSESTPVDLRVQFGVYANGVDVETWVDDVAVLTYGGEQQCSEATVTSVGARAIWENLGTSADDASLFSLDTTPEGFSAALGAGADGDALEFTGAPTSANVSTVVTLAAYRALRSETFSVEAPVVDTAGLASLRICQDQVVLQWMPTDGWFEFFARQRAPVGSSGIDLSEPPGVYSRVTVGGQHVFEVARYQAPDPPNDYLDNSTTRSYAFWYTAKQISASWTNILHRGESNNVRQPSIWQYPNSLRLHIRLGGMDNYDHGCNPSTVMVVGEPKHIVLTHTPTDMRVYYDGLLVCSTTFPGGFGAPYDNGALMQPFKVSDDFYLSTEGTIHDFRIYTGHALNLYQVESIYRESSTRVSALVPAGPPVELRCMLAADAVRVYEGGNHKLTVQRVPSERTSPVQFSAVATPIDGSTAVVSTFQVRDVKVREHAVSSATAGTFCPATGNYYRFVALEDVSWDDAAASALALTYAGSGGHLATITSAAENECAALETACSSAWLGASWVDDGAGGGDWRWAAGPEAGTVVGSAGAGAYAAWGAIYGVAGGDAPPPEPGYESIADYRHITQNAESCGELITCASGCAPIGSYRFGQWQVCGANCTANGVLGYLVEFESPDDNAADFARAVLGASAAQVSTQLAVSSPGATAVARANLLRRPVDHVRYRSDANTTETAFYFSAGDGDQWLEVDLGADRNISRVTVDVVSADASFQGVQEADDTAGVLNNTVWDAVAVGTATEAQGSGGTYFAWGSVGQMDGVVDVTATSPVALTLAPFVGAEVGTPVRYRPESAIPYVTARYVRVSLGPAPTHGGGDAGAGSAVRRIRVQDVEDTYARLVYAGVDESPNLPGINAVVVDADASTVKSVRNWALETQEEVDDFIGFIAGDDEVSAGDTVLLATRDMAGRTRALLEETWDEPVSYNDILRSQLTNVQLEQLGYQAVPASTWLEAGDTCRNLGGRMCTFEDYCYTGEGQRQVYYGYRTGHAYAAFDKRDGSANTWVYIGNADTNQRCYTYEENEGEAPSEATLRDTDELYVLCCKSNNDARQWQLVQEAGEPRWRIEQSRVRSVYRGTRVGTDCPAMDTSNFMDTNYVWLAETDAVLWRDYSLRMDYWAYDWGLGFIFHYADADNYYRWIQHVSASQKCGTLERRSNGVWTRLAAMTTQTLPMVERLEWQSFGVDVAESPAGSGNLRIRVVIEDQVVADVLDDDGGAILRGSVGVLQRYGYYNYWDNIIVREFTVLGVSAHNVSAALFELGVASDTQLDRGSWAAIARKNATAGTVPVVSTADGSVVSATAPFACEQHTVVVPEGARIGAAVGAPLAVRGAALPDGFALRPGLRADASQPTALESSALRAFAVNAGSGLVHVDVSPGTAGSHAVNFEALVASGATLMSAGDAPARARVNISVSVRGGSYDSGWFPFASQMGDSSFTQLHHALDRNPALLYPRVMVKAVDGPNEGFVFQGSSAQFATDYAVYRDYGGLLFGWSSTHLRMWAPSMNTNYANGFLVHVGTGWGGKLNSAGDYDGEHNPQAAHNADVRVSIVEQHAADYDSGWMSMRSQIDSASYARVSHGLGVAPARVRVMVRASDGNNKGYVFEGAGANQVSDGPTKLYGGVVFGYDDVVVTAWLPTRYHRADRVGHAVAVGDGWAGNLLNQASDSVDVRIRAWVEHDYPADYESAWMPMVYDDVAYLEVPHGLGEYPEEVVVLIQPKTGSHIGMTFVATGMSQQTNYDTYINYGGVVQAYDDETVRLWAPSRNPLNNARTASGLTHVRYGWGGEMDREQSQIADVKVYAWKSRQGLTSEADMGIEVADVNEPPTTADATWAINENSPEGLQLGSVVGADEDLGGEVTYTVVAGNAMDALAVDAASGAVSILTGAAINFELFPWITAVVRVSDGLLYAYAMVTVEVININDVPVIQQDAVVEVEEESPVNTLVGYPINATDEDADQTIFFSIVGGNALDAFKISACAGQLRVRTAVVDYETQDYYNLTVFVTDDGDVPLNATAYVAVNVLNRNDPPDFLPQTRRVPENSRGGTLVDVPVMATDQDGDPLTYNIEAGNEAGLFVLNSTTGQLSVREGAALDYETRPSYTLVFTAADAEFAVEAEVVVALIDVNDAPVITTSSLTVAENTADDQLVGAVHVSDQDYNDTLIGAAFVLADEGPNPAEWGAFTVAYDGRVFVRDSALLDYETTQQFLLRINATDAGGPEGPHAGANITVSHLVRVNVQNVDEPPYIFPASLSVEENSAVGTFVGQLDAGDEDLDSAVQFTITQGNMGGAFEVNTTGAVLVLTPILDYEAIAAYSLDVLVEDATEPAVPVNASALIEVSIVNVNDAPDMAAGCTASGFVWRIRKRHTAMVGLLGSPAEADGVNTFNFGKMTGATAVASCRDACDAVAGGACAAFSYFGSTHSNSIFRSFCVGRSAQVSQAVDPVAAPVTAGSKATVCHGFSVPENSNVGLAVGTPMRATDQDTVAQSTSIAFAVPIDNMPVAAGGDGNGGEAFTVSATSGATYTDAQLFVAHAVLNYEVQSEYFLTLVARDSVGDASNFTVYVSLSDVNDRPVVPHTWRNASESSPPGTQILPAVFAHDDDPGTVLAFSIVDPEGLFEIDPATGIIFVGSAQLPALQDSSVVYAVTVSASDSELSGSGTVEITLRNFNQAPVFTSEPPPTTRTINENSASGTRVDGASFAVTDLDDLDVMTFSVELAPDPDGSIFGGGIGSDGSLEPTYQPFEIVKTGNYEAELRVRAGGEVNFEAVPSYTLRVTVTDSGEGNLVDVVDVVVDIVDVNDTPGCDVVPVAINENSAVGVVAGPAGGQTCYDDDVDDVLSYAIVGGNTGGVFSIAPSPGDPRNFRLSVATPVLNFEALEGYSIEIEVTDNHGASSEWTVAVAVVDVNEAPWINDATFAVSEIAALGQVVGNMTAGDPDFKRASFSGLQFSIDDPLDIFAVDPRTGVLVVDRRNAIDYEFLPQLVFHVTVDDGADVTSSAGVLAATAQVTVNVIDVNDITITRFSGDAASDMSTAGGQTILLHGSNYGTANLNLDPSPVSVTYGPTGSEYTAEDCAVAGEGADRNKLIECTTAPGSGGPHVWTVHVGGWSKASVAPVTTSYALPVVADVVGAAGMSTHGGAVVTVIGDNFGPAGTLVFASYKSDATPLYTTTACTVVVPHTSVECTSVPGVGRDHLWSVWVDFLASQLAAVPSESSYRPPLVSSIVAPVLSTAGNEGVLLYGDNFGPIGTLAISATYGGVGNDRFAAATCSIATPHESIACVSAPGVGANLHWVLTVAGQRSTPSNDTTSYLPPQLVRVTGPGAINGTTQGGARVSLFGENFGPPGLDVTYVATYGPPPAADQFVAVQCRVVSLGSGEAGQAFGEIDCETSPGVGRGHAYVLTVDGQPSNVLHANASYGPPVVGSVEGIGAVSGTPGNEAVVITGVNFGPNAQTLDLVSYGPEGATDRFTALRCLVSQAHTQITCDTNSGAGLGLIWQVVVGGQPSVTQTTMYGLPDVTDITGAGAAGASTDGGQAVTLSGLDFGGLLNPAQEPDGREWYLQQVTYGPSGSEFEARDCVLSVPHNQIDCVTAPGVGGSLQWAVTVEGQTGYSTVFSSYAAPSIATVTHTNGPTEGGALVTVTGANMGFARAPPMVKFGNCDPDPAGAGVQAGLYPWPCPALVTSDLAAATDVIKFRVPDGHGTDVEVRVVAGGQSSPPGAFVYSYDAPVIENILVSGDIAPGVPVPDGFTGLKLIGRNFGNGRVSFAEIRVPDGSTGPAATSGTGGVNGTAAGVSNAVVSLGGGLYECVASSFNHTFVHCVAPVRAGNVTVVIAGRRSNSRSFSFFSPVITRTTELRGPTVGGNQVLVYGRYFAQPPSLRVFIGGKPCLVTADLPDNVDDRDAILTVTVPEGQGLQRQLVVRVVDLDSEPVFYNYDKPVISSWAVKDPGTGAVSLEPWNTVGGQLLEIIGTNLGLTAQLVINGEVFPTVASVDGHTQITMTTPEAEGQNRALAVLIGNQMSDPAAELISYKRPALNSVDVDDPVALRSTAGYTFITMRGTNFGRQQSGTAEVVFREAFWDHNSDSQGTGTPGEMVFTRQLEISTWSHFVVRAYAPAGQGTLNRLQVTAGNQASTESAFYSYQAPVLDVEASGPTSGPTSGYRYDDTTGEVTDQPVLVTLVGSGFGASCLLTFGPVTDMPTRDLEAATGAALIHYSDTAITFELPPGVGVGHQVKVDVSGQVPSERMPFSYDRPVVFDVLHATEGWLRVWQGLPPFDDPSAPQPLLHGPTDACIEFEAPELWRMRQQRDQVFSERFCCQPALLSFRGQNFGGNDEWLDVMWGGEALTGPDGRCSYDANNAAGLPWCAEVDPVDYCTEEPAPGCECADSSACVSLQRHCRLFSPTHTSMTVLPPSGIGINVSVSLDVGGQLTAPAQFDYDAPTVERVRENPYDARGASLELLGRNHGSELNPASALVIELNNLTCVDPRVRRDATGRKHFGMPYLTCDAPGDVSGVKQGYISIAEQDNSFDAAFSQCRVDYFGQSGELCLDCPEGATCAGRYDEPVATAGFWKFDNVAFETLPPQHQPFCHEQRAAVDACPQVVACEPKFACTGANTCDPRYARARCTVCAPQHYRIDGECEPCPDNPWLIALMFLLAGICAGAGGYVLNRKAVNLGLLSIGVDYFQVLAILARSRVRFPEEIRELMSLLSFFNLNLELTAPECSFPDITFAFKWGAAMSLPLVTGSLFVVLHLSLWAWKRCCLRQSKAVVRSHTHVLVGTFLTLIYYMYLFLTRFTLDIFNCNPTDPPDGKEYLQAVFEECWVPGGVHLALLPWAVVALLGYVIAYPALCVYILYNGRHLMKEDQLLRAMRLGDSRATNPNAYEFRLRYHKLYYNFKPQYTYWILVVIARKFWLAMTSLMFRRNPSFQMAAALLMVFISFSLQMKYQPYMSTSEFEDVLEEHKKLADKGSPLHVKLAEAIVRAKEGKRDIRKTHKLGERKTSTQVSRADIERLRKAAAKSLYNYNTLDAVLLACAVMVCLSGVMFESGRFETTYYEGQQKTLTYFVIVMVSASIVYWFTVFFTEVAQAWDPDACSGRAGKKTKDKHKAEAQLKAKEAMLSTQRSFRGLGAVDSPISPKRGEGGGGGAGAMMVMSNPMHSGEAQMKAANLPTEPPDPAQWALIKDKFNAMEKNIAQLKKQRKEIARQLTTPARPQTRASRGASAESKDEAAGRKVSHRRRMKKEFTAKTGTRLSGAAGRGRGRGRGVLSPVRQVGPHHTAEDEKL